MHAAGPPVPEFLLHGASRERKPGLIEERDLLALVGNPDHHRRRVGHVAETLFAFSQGGLSLFPLADIRKQAEESLRRARIVMDRHTGDAHPDGRSVGSAQSEIEGPAVAGKSARKVILRIGQFLRKDAAETGLFRHRLEADSQKLRHSGVTEDSPAFSIDDPNALGHCLDNPAIHVLAEAHAFIRKTPRIPYSVPPAKRL